MGTAEFMNLFMVPFRLDWFLTTFAEVEIAFALTIANP